jgi:type IV pilus assembly protein PilA
MMNAPPPPVAAPKKGMPTWVLVLLCTFGAGVLILPIVLVLAVYGVRKYIANAKTAEARNSVAQIAKDAAASFDPSTRFCASAASPVPADASRVSGKKYMSAPADWGSESDRAIRVGFPCLGFSLSEPQYYQYNYVAPGPVHDRFVTTARGDLNGDGVFSTFTAKGTVTGGVPAIEPALSEASPQE